MPFCPALPYIQLQIEHDQKITNPELPMSRTNLKKMSNEKDSFENVNLTNEEICLKFIENQFNFERIFFFLTINERNEVVFPIE